MNTSVLLFYYYYYYYYYYYFFFLLFFFTFPGFPFTFIVMLMRFVCIIIVHSLLFKNCFSIISRQPISEQLESVWTGIQQRGWVNIEATHSLESLLNTGGSQWFVTNVVKVNSHYHKSDFFFKLNINSLIIIKEMEFQMKNYRRESKT